VIPSRTYNPPTEVDKPSDNNTNVDIYFSVHDGDAFLEKHFIQYCHSQKVGKPNKLKSLGARKSQCLNKIAKLSVVNCGQNIQKG